LFRIIQRYEKYSIQKYKSTTTPIPIGTICRILKIFAVFFGIITIIETSGIDITGLLAFGGVSTVVLGFASRDLLANFFGAIFIYLDKPFEVGDWIRSPDKEIEGTVEHISWRLTKIIKFDKRPLYVPNSIFASIAIENASRMYNRRIKEEIGIRYSDTGVIKEIVADIRTMLMKHEAIDINQPLIVNLVKFSHSSTDILIYAFTKTTDRVQYLEIKQDVLLKISDIIDSNGAKIAFPTRTLHLESNKDLSHQVITKKNQSDTI
jgi:MscS family membrane protein